jgi:hypothetical protein
MHSIISLKNNFDSKYLINYLLIFIIQNFQINLINKYTIQIILGIIEAAMSGNLMLK